MSSGARPARLIAFAAAAVASVAVDLTGRGDAAFANAGAFDDPRVGGVDACFEVGVRDPTVGYGVAPADDRDRKPGHATRSQATGWP